MKSAVISFLTTALFLTLTPSVGRSLSPLRQTKSVRVGDLAPTFALEDHHGRKVELADVRGKSPVILVFYRGYW